jgi:hypothetical protein
MAGCAVTDLLAVGSKPLGDGWWGQSDLEDYRRGGLAALRPLHEATGTTAVCWR